MESPTTDIFHLLGKFIFAFLFSGVAMLASYKVVTATSAFSDKEKNIGNRRLRSLRRWATGVFTKHIDTHRSTRMAMFVPCLDSEKSERLNEYYG